MDKLNAKDPKSLYCTFTIKLPYLQQTYHIHCWIFEYEETLNLQVLTGFEMAPNQNWIPLILMWTMTKSIKPIQSYIGCKTFGKAHDLLN